MGFSLVACSSNEPEEKVEEKKIEETKAAEEKEEKLKEEKKEEEKAKAAEKVLITKLIANTVFKLNCTHN